MEKEIKQVVENYIQAIHTQDKELFYSVFSSKQECRLISIGNEFCGVENIYNDFLIGAIQKAYSNIDLINDGMKINIISDELAIVLFSYHTDCTLRENGEYFSIRGLETQVMIKEDGCFKLVHVHYSKV